MKYTKTIVIFATLLLLLSTTATVSAEWIWRPDIGWINTKEIVKASPEEQFEYGKRLMDDGDMKNAAKAFRMLIYNYPDSKLAGSASVMAAKCLFETKYYYSSFLALRTAIRHYPASIDLREAAKMLFDIGSQFLAGAKREFLGIRFMSGTESALQVFEEAFNTDPWGEYGDDSLLGIADTYKDLRRYPEAIDAYNKLIETFPNSPLVASARLQQAKCYDLKSRSWSYDYLSMTKAAETLREIKPEADVSEQAEALREIIEDRLAHKHYETAHFYQKRKKYLAADIYYRKVMTEFPNTVWAEKAKADLEKIKPEVDKLKGSQQNP